MFFYELCNGIIASDIIESYGGKLAELNDRAIHKLREILPPIILRENPVDLSFSGFDPKILGEVIQTLSEDDNVGLIMFIYALASPNWSISPNELGNAIRRSKKPVLVVYTSSLEDYELVKSFERKGVMICDTLEYAAKIAAKIQRID